jgi:hypothetical protein
VLNAHHGCPCLPLPALRPQQAAVRLAAPLPTRSQTCSPSRLLLFLSLPRSKPLFFWQADRFKNLIDIYSYANDKLISRVDLQAPSKPVLFFSRVSAQA